MSLEARQIQWPPGVTAAAGPGATSVPALMHAGADAEPLSREPRVAARAEAADVGARRVRARVNLSAELWRLVATFLCVKRVRVWSHPLNLPAEVWSHVAKVLCVKRSVVDVLCKQSLEGARRWRKVRAAEIRRAYYWQTRRGGLIRGCSRRGV